MSEQSDRTRGLVPFQPGQSGNPSGRPKRKPITDALVRELDAAARGGGTKAEAAAKRLVGLMLTGKPAIALEAAKLVLAYVEGPPVQTVTFEIEERAAALAKVTGADPHWLVNRAKEIAAAAEAGVTG